MRPSISVCLAAYNGAKYIKQQIDSIICQLKSGDELIIVDDCSTDTTTSVIDGIKWPGISLYKNNKNIGHVKTFARAIELAKNEVIFLSDQDDIWLQNRVELMLSFMKKYDCHLIITRQFDFNGTPPCFEIDYEKFTQKCKQYALPLAMLKLLIGESQLPLFGCGMAFRKKLSSLLLPFPEQIEAHDHWISTCALASGNCLFVDYPTILRRVHGQNLSPTKSRSLRLITRTRLRQVYYFLIAFKRKTNSNHFSYTMK